MRQAAFILGTGYNAYGIIRSLVQHRIPIVAFYDRNESVGFARLSKYCEARPLSNNEEQLCEELVRHLANLDLPPVLYATSDWYASVLSSHSQKLSKHFLYHWVPATTVSVFVDKSETTGFCLKSEVRIPRTHVPLPDEDVTRSAYEFSYPCVVKPFRQFSAGFPLGKKNFVAHSPEELIEFYRTNPKSLAIWQQHIEGGDDCVLTCTALVRESGEVGALCGVRKLRQYPPGFGNMSFGQSKFDEVIATETVRILRLLNYRGLAEVEFKYDPASGSNYFIEMNGRLPAYNSLFCGTGVDLAYLAYCDLTHKPLPELLPSQRDGVHWICLASDLGSLLRTPRGQRIGFVKWAAEMLRVRLHAWFDWQDPKPFVAYAVSTVRIALTHLKQRVGWKRTAAAGWLEADCSSGLAGSGLQQRVGWKRTALVESNEANKERQFFPRPLVRTRSECRDCSILGKLAMLVNKFRAGREAG